MAGNINETVKRILKETKEKDEMIKGALVR